MCITVSSQTVICITSAPAVTTNPLPVGSTVGADCDGGFPATAAVAPMVIDPKAINPAIEASILAHDGHIS
jgi:hypothetical protein